MKKVARISPSKLERFRLYLDGAFRGSITEQSVIETIKGEGTTSLEAEIGTAYHYAIEKGPQNFYEPSRQQYIVRNRELSGPYYFSREQMAPALEFRAMYPRMVYEIPHVFRLRVNGVDVEMHMRIDGAHGLHIHEQKTTRNESFIDHFAESLQWKVYLLSTGAQLVQYNIFQITDIDENYGNSKINYLSFRVYNRPNLLADITNTIISYLDFTESKNLTDYVFR